MSASRQLEEEAHILFLKEEQLRIAATLQQVTASLVDG
jgi:hypothetical protein